MLVTLRWFHWLRAWHKYPYVSLLFGALLTALTVVMGVNPTGAGPRLWLGFGEMSWFGAGVFLSAVRITQTTACNLSCSIYITTPSPSAGAA